MFFSEYNECNLCPRHCGARRNDSIPGVCGCNSTARISWMGPHFGEEPPISGTNGSGTVFFGGCTLRCRFCQNYQISLEASGKEYTFGAMCNSIEYMFQNTGVHNINFVTPDHFTPHVAAACRELRKRGLTIPFLANVSGYEHSPILDALLPVIDIWLPDYKYSDRKLAQNLSCAPDYPGIALKAIERMISQKGFLHLDDNGIADNGVLVRHLILPGMVKNSCDALSTLFIEFGADLPVSLMSQYRPVRPMEDPFSRMITNDEFYEVLDFAQSLGFENMYVQYPENGECAHLLPDFSRTNPFQGFSI